MNRSCIVENFSNFMTLSAQEQQVLEAFEANPQSVRREQQLWSVHDSTSMLYTLQKGWAYAYKMSLTGEMKVVEVFIPGDIIGLRDFTFGKHLTNVRMLTDGAACAFPYAHILQACQDSRALTAAFFAAASRIQALMTERVTTLMHCSARMKIAHFIIEIFLRLQSIYPGLGHQFEFPLNQKLLASLLGLTNVHVSRTLSDLQRDGLLRKQRRNIEILDYERLHQEAQFDDAYIRLDMSRLFNDN